MASNTRTNLLAYSVFLKFFFSINPHATKRHKNGTNSSIPRSHRIPRNAVATTSAEESGDEKAMVTRE